MWGDDRAQAHALEAFTAALLMLAGLLFALQATAVTPLSASTSNQHLENQQRKMATDTLATLDSSGALESAVLNWTSSDGFGGPQNGAYANPSNISEFGTFGATMNRIFLSEGAVMNVYITYQNKNGKRATETVVFMGTPSDNAVVATRTIVLMDSDKLTRTGLRLGDSSSSYFAPDIAAADPLYNVLEVRIVIWQN